MPNEKNALIAFLEAIKALRIAYEPLRRNLELLQNKLKIRLQTTFRG